MVYYSRFETKKMSSRKRSTKAPKVAPPVGANLPLNNAAANPATTRAIETVAQCIGIKPIAPSASTVVDCRSVRSCSL